MCCPTCKSESVVKNGFNATGKQMYLCNECGRQFVLNPGKGPISDEKKELIDRLLLERISLAGIARVVGVSDKIVWYKILHDKPLWCQNRIIN